MMPTRCAAGPSRSARRGAAFACCGVPSDPQARGAARAAARRARRVMAWIAGDIGRLLREAAEYGGSVGADTVDKDPSETRAEEHASRSPAGDARVLAWHVLLAQPALQRRDDVRLLRAVEWSAAPYAVPLLETSAAAGRRRVLRDEDRVSAPRRLLTVLRGRGRREPLRDEASRVLDDGRQSLRVQVVALAPPEAEAAAKGR